jgi:hypothetical protein
MLGIGVGDAIPQAPDSTEPHLHLDNDGYYWFLHPLFEQLAGETGQYIDLYGDAMFAGRDLDALERTLSAARRLVETHPDSWKVHIGTQVEPTFRELYRSVEHSVFLELLAVWDQAIERARRTGRAVVCFGD